MEEVSRNGAREMLQAAIENEVAEYLERHSWMTDEKGHRLAVRNGYLPERDIVSGIGPVSVRQPRVDDRKVRKQGAGTIHLRDSSPVSPSGSQYRQPDTGLVLERSIDG